MSVIRTRPWCAAPWLLYFATPLLAGPATPCDQWADHFDGFAYLEQLRAEQHSFRWQGSYFTGCRVEQLTHHHLLQPPAVRQLIPAGWSLQPSRQETSLIYQQAGAHFCLLSISEQQYQHWRLECALRPLAW